MARKAGGGKAIVLGIPEIDRALRKIPLALEKKVIRQAVRASLRPVLSAVKENAPVRSGATKKAAKIRVPKGRKRGRIALNVTVGEGDYLGKQFYAAFEEFGHDVYDRAGMKSGHHEGSHWMEEAFDRTAEAAREDCEERIRLGAEDVILALGKKTR